MKQVKTQSEFEDFAKKKGHKVVNGMVTFGRDDVATEQFQIEAEEVGFAVIRDFSQAGSYSGADDLSKLPRDWFVRLESES